MRILKNPIVLLIALTTIFVSCDDKKKQEQARQKIYEIGMLQSQILDYQSMRNSLNTELSNEKAKLLDYTRSKFQIESKLSGYESKVEAYLMNHKMAVACIVGGLSGASVSFDTTSEFSTEMKEVADLVTVFSAIYAILNFSEISEVADVIAQADNNVKNIKNEIDRVNMMIINTKKNIGTKDTQLITLNNTIEDTRNQISNLSI